MADSGWASSAIEGRGLFGRMLDFWEDPHYLMCQSCVSLVV